MSEYCDLRQEDSSSELGGSFDLREPPDSYVLRKELHGSSFSEPGESDDLKKQSGGPYESREEFEKGAWWASRFEAEIEG